MATGLISVPNTHVKTGTGASQTAQWVKVLAAQVWPPEFDPWKPRKGRGEDRQRTGVL